MDYLKSVLALTQVFEEREKKWAEFCDSVKDNPTQEPIEFSLDDIENYALYDNLQKKSSFNVEKMTSKRATGCTARSQTSKKVITLAHMVAAMPQDRDVKKSRCLARKYLKEQTWDYSTDECLAVITFIEKEKPLFKALSFELADMERKGLKGTQEYNDCQEMLKETFQNLASTVEMNLVQLYGYYVMWLYEKRRKQKE